MNVYKIDPDADLDFQFDWSDWLDDDSSEAIALSVITIDPSGELTATTPAVNSGVVTFWLSGGVATKRYIVSCKITTNSSPTREDERSITINCFER